jgi:hypothetical protein
MDMIDMPVTLIVKAPNQQVEDQTVHCELNWTIRKLKGYLSEVYPSKPVSFNLVNFNFFKVIVVDYNNLNVFVIYFFVLWCFKAHRRPEVDILWAIIAR